MAVVKAECKKCYQNEAAFIAASERLWEARLEVQRLTDLLETCSEPVATVRQEQEQEATPINSEMVTLRVTPSEKAQLVKAAEKQKTTVTAVLLSGAGVRKTDREMRLTRQEAAKALRISVRTLEKRVNEGTLKVVRDGKRVFILQSELDRYLRAGEVG